MTYAFNASQYLRYERDRQSCKVHRLTRLILDGLLVPGTGAGDSSDFITS